MLTVIKGAGDIASGIALRLKHAKFDVVMTDIDRPTAIRRTVCFSQAIVNGTAQVEDVKAEKANNAEEIKKLYAMRWGIETSFRELKYAVGLTSFHSKKSEYITQEIWARLILYNFCEIITAHVTITKCTNRHVYQINYTFAIHICKYFISKMAEKSPPDVEALISKEILPVRPGRHDPRKVDHKKAVSFLYRVA